MRNCHILPLIFLGTLTFLAFETTAREQRLLEHNWQFLQGDVKDAAARDFVAKAWETVSLPHNWGWQQAQRGEKYLRGPGWYRQQLDLGAPKPGRRYFMRFEAAGSVADV